MAGISSIYTKDVHDNLRPLWGNWEPSKPIELGDYGIMLGAKFAYMGTIKDLGMKFSIRSHDLQDHKYFASANTAEVTFNAKGAVPAGGTVGAKANVEVNFKSRGSVFFNAAGCTYTMIKDKVALGKAVMKKYDRRDHSWEREWVVITDLVKAAATTVMISGGESASFVLEAAGNVERINLADASIGFGLKKSTNVGYSVVAEKGLTPLLGLCQIQGRFLSFFPTFRPAEKYRLIASEVRDTLEDSPRVQTEESTDALDFVQLR